MKKPKSKTPKPQRWLYCLARGFCCAVSKLLFRLQITGADSLPKEGPVLFLCNHQGMMDFLLVFAAIKGRMAQFVATQRQFRNPKLHWLYVRLGVIPKMQFHTDPRCVMNILRVLKNGGAIVLFPTGQTAMWGVPGNMDPSIAHLVKRSLQSKVLTQIQMQKKNAQQMKTHHLQALRSKLQTTHSLVDSHSSVCTAVF